MEFSSVVHVSGCSKGLIKWEYADVLCRGVSYSVIDSKRFGNKLYVNQTLSAIRGLTGALKPSVLSDFAVMKLSLIVL